MKSQSSLRPMNRVISLYKPIGVSPVELINQFKAENPEYKDEVVSYAGRLDPLAHGVMVLLIGEANKQRREYEKSDKTYEFKAILGFKTDSYDICGIVQAEPTVKIFTEESLRPTIESFKGKQEQYFPPFSSFRIKGKPLFKWARDGKLDEIEIPKKNIEVYNIELLKIETIKGKELLNKIVSRINLLKGDFRQDTIIEKWNAVMDANREYQILSMKADVSSGTYIRGIVDELGKRLGYMATTFEIQRTRSGKYTT
ncbi:hypothetical protein HYV12_03490 [Candidatus Dojkabacteria bacterium]|nr:hypothetical protein [Candidatus Dojkabacteria bacterium]